jgi:hypothetical protein
MGCVLWLGLAVLLMVGMLSGDPKDGVDASWQAMLFFILFVSAPLLLGGIRDPKPTPHP